MQGRSNIAYCNMCLLGRGLSLKIFVSLYAGSRSVAGVVHIGLCLVLYGKGMGLEYVFDHLMKMHPPPVR